MSNIINLPRAPESMKLWEWLRAQADELEREGVAPDDFGILVVVKHDDEGNFVVRGRKYNVDTLETVGALYTAAQDWNDDSRA